MNHRLKNLLLAVIFLTGLSAWDENVGEKIGDSVQDLGDDIEDAAEN